MAKITGLTYQLLRVKLSITMVVPTEITAPSIPNIPIPFMVYHPIIKNGLLEISTFLPIIFPIKPPCIDDFPIFSQSNLPFCPYFPRFPQFFGDFGCSNSGDRIPGSPDPRIPGSRSQLEEFGMDASELPQAEVGSGSGVASLVQQVGPEIHPEIHC